MTCPSCGAPMHLKEDAQYLRCDYCETVHFPEENSDGVRVLGEKATKSCPICAIPLEEAVLSGERMLYCGRCRGMLIEMDKFVAMIGNMRSRRETGADAARQPDWKDLDRRIRCPKCGRTMDTHPYGGPGNVILDDCENCSLNWLDYGELERIVRAPDHHYETEYAAPAPKPASKK
jgi:LSD1 subclass zinc finger protein